MGETTLRLLIDFGSTFTKLVVVDLEREEFVQRYQAPSTVDTDITIGLAQVLRQAQEDLGLKDFAKDTLVACSSAAGGLRMITVGLVPSLSCEAGVRAALGAGAKVLHCFSYKLGRADVSAIEKLYPDIILLIGGTDGGNKEVILYNAAMLTKSSWKGPIIVAGNRDARDEIGSIFNSSGHSITFADNVLPTIGTLEVASCREAIRSIFISHIIKAKGIDQARQLVGDIIMPTPAAVLQAAQLLADGVDGEQGWGDLIIVDVGGATTDVHSIAKGYPTHAEVMTKGLPEPYAKRTVEGDLGVRHNLDTLLEIARRTGRMTDPLALLASRFTAASKLPEDDLEYAFDHLLTSIAVDVAGGRHCGTLKLAAGPTGEFMIQEGKDLSAVACVIGTGGPLVFAKDPSSILQHVLFRAEAPLVLRPKEARFYLDSSYALYAMGLLARSEPAKALRIMKKIMKPL